MKNIRTIFLITGSFLLVQNAATAQTKQAEPVTYQKASDDVRTNSYVKYEQQNISYYGLRETKAKPEVKSQPAKPDPNKAYPIENPTNNTPKGEIYHALDENRKIMGAEKMDQKTITKLKDEENKAKKEAVQQKLK